jgi:ABC-type branched-subunit amino acid transport system substrate-binding protein
MTMKSFLSTVSLALLIGGASATAQAQIAIGHLADYSGGTSDVGTPYGQAVADTFAWVNKNGGIGGKQLNVDSNDYGYQVPRAIALYKKWSAPDTKVSAIMGWGTADTEALTGFLAQDKIPDISGSYAAALSDPEGTSGKAKPAPYNFFYGPTYSDSMRAMLTWAADDWKAKGKPGKPKFVHMGANHPYPNAPKAAGEALATELGFEVLPPLVFALAPGDYSAQCLSLKSSGANYAYLGNTAASNISVLKACKAAGVDVQFLGNVWGMDENAAKTAADAHGGGVERQCAGHEDGDGNLKDVRSDRQGLSPRALHRRRLQRAIFEGSARVGRQEWRHRRRERGEGLLSEKGLGAGRHGGRLQPLDLDREGPSRHAQGRSLSLEDFGANRWRYQRPDGQGHHQAREGQDGGAAAQAGMVRVVR